VTVDQLTECFAAIAVLWPHFDAPPATFALGQRLLGPMDARAVAAAIEQLALEGREFAPPLGLVARRAHELVREVHGERVPDAAQALHEVYDRIARVGFYGIPTWSHPAIGAAVEAMGGWPSTCRDDNPEAYRAHFLRVYDTVRGRLERESLVAPSLRELLDSVSVTTALPAAVADVEEIFVPPAGEALADRSAVLGELAAIERRSTRVLAFASPRPRLRGNAHDFGDHALCGPDCPDRPTTEDPAP